MRPVSTAGTDLALYSALATVKVKEEKLERARTSSRRKEARLRSAIQDSAAEAQALRTRLAELVQEAECPLCMERPAVTAFDCGHMYCCNNDCESSQVPVCPTCEAAVQTRTGVFGAVQMLGELVESGLPHGARDRTVEEEEERVLAEQRREARIVELEQELVATKAKAEQSEAKARQTAMALTVLKRSQQKEPAFDGAMGADSSCEGSSVSGRSGANSANLWGSRSLGALRVANDLFYKEMEGWKVERERREGLAASGKDEATGPKRGRAKASIRDILDTKRTLDAVFTLLDSVDKQRLWSATDPYEEDEDDEDDEEDEDDDDDEVHGVKQRKDGIDDDGQPFEVSAADIRFALEGMEGYFQFLGNNSFYLGM